MTLNFYSSPDHNHKQKITVQNITIMSQNVNLGEISGASAAKARND